MAAFALLTASGRSLYPNTTRPLTCSALAADHALQQYDQHEHEYGGQVEGYSTDAQGGKESPDGSEDGLGQVIQNTVRDRQTRKSPTAGERTHQIEDHPAQQ